MLSEQEMFDIAEATKQPDEQGASLNLWWLAVPCVMSICILALLVASYH